MYRYQGREPGASKEGSDPATPDQLHVGFVTLTLIGTNSSVSVFLMKLGKKCNACSRRTRRAPPESPNHSTP